MYRIGILFCLLISLPAAAEIYNMSQLGQNYVQEYLLQVDKTDRATLKDPTASPLQCLPLYYNAIEKGVIDIRYAFGYFDLSEGKEEIWQDQNYGYSPSLDIGFYNGLRKVLLNACPKDSNLVLCGFTDVGPETQGKSILEKKIKVYGKDVKVRITMTQGSASESYEDNRGRLSRLQEDLTRQSEENFFDSIGEADIVIYNGHSRDGGGPDFAPPILDRHMHTNYPLYRARKPGFKKLLEALRRHPKNDTVLALLSCDSKDHFRRLINQINSKQRLIMTEEILTNVDVLKSSVGYLDGILKGKCGQALDDYANPDPVLKKLFRTINLD